MSDSVDRSFGAEQIPKVAEPKLIDSSNEDLLSSLGTKDALAAALTKQGRYVEAETILTEVIKTRERLGQTRANPDMLRTMNNLAAALHHQGRLAEAETLHRQVLEADEQSLGSEHPSTIISMHNLASLLAHQGKLDEAEELLQRAIKASQKVHGPEAHVTLGNMGAMGDVLHRQHRYEEAETIYRKVLELHRKVLREHHPDLGTGMHNLAAVLRKQGKNDEADELYRQEIALREANVKEMIGSSAQDRSPASQGQYDEVERSLQDKLKLSTEASSRNSRETRSNMNRLGDVLIRNGRYKEAEGVFRDVLVLETA